MKAKTSTKLEVKGRARSELSAVPGSEDDLGHGVGGQAELACDLLGPLALLVVQQRQPLLRFGPRVAGGPGDRRARRSGTAPSGPGPTGLGLTGLGRLGPGRTRGGGAAGLSGAGLSGADLSGAGLGRAGRRHRGAERTTPLVGELAAGQLVLGLLVKEQVLFGRLVHADGDHGQTLEVLLLALRLHAVVVLLCPVGMQFAPARNALGHKPSFVMRAPGWVRVDGPLYRQEPVRCATHTETGTRQPRAEYTTGHCRTMEPARTAGRRMGARCAAKLSDKA